MLLLVPASLYQRLVMLAAVAVIPVFARDSIDELRQPKPLLHLDNGGIEGSFGRIPWHNVERVTISARWEWPARFRPKLVLHLRHRMQPAPPTRRRWASDLT